MNIYAENMHKNEKFLIHYTLDMHKFKCLQAKKIKMICMHKNNKTLTLKYCRIYLYKEAL